MQAATQGVTPAPRPLCGCAQTLLAVPGSFEPGQHGMAASAGVVRGVQVRSIAGRVERGEEDRRQLARPVRLRNDTMRLRGEDADGTVLRLRSARPLGLGDLAVHELLRGPGQIDLGAVGGECRVEARRAVLVVDVPLHVVLRLAAVDDSHVGASDAASAREIVRLNDLVDLLQERPEGGRDVAVDDQGTVRQVDPAGAVVTHALTEGARQVGGDTI